MFAAWRRLRPRRARQELLTTLLVTGAGGLFGAWLGQVWAGLAGALALLVVLHLRRLLALRAWAGKSMTELPDARGLWGETFELLYERHRRWLKRKKELVEIVAEFQASTAALPDGAVVLAPRGEIAWFNVAAQALLGLRPQDAGLRIINLIRNPVFTGYMLGGDFSAEVEIISPVNDNVTLSLQIIPYGQGQRLLIVRDVSERRRLDAARRDFIANASHELRTPLTVLTSYLEMMEPESQGEGALAAWRAPIAEMRGQAARMQALVEDMLKLARLEAHVLTARQQVLDMPELLRSSLAGAEALSQNRHRFAAHLDSGLWLVGRESELQSVVTNLLQNAVLYTPAGGEIRVAWEGDEHGAQLTVTDTGIGIPEEDIPRVTERFYRVDVGRSRATGGTGLGLSIVKHALENHEARLEIRSRVGAGSTFICHFPAHRMRHRQVSAVALKRPGVIDP